MIAIPRLQAPAFSGAKLREALSAPWVGPTAAAGLLAGAMATMLAMIGPVGGAGAPVVKTSLSSVFRKAPQGWRQALTAPHGLTITEDVVRLSERPLAPMASQGWNAAVRRVPVMAGGPLPPAPIAGFFAPGPGGPLPIIAQDGRTPFEAYARPFASNGRPKVALVIGGLGLNARATQQAIQTLRPEITLSFVPYAEGLQGWIDMARAHGHEVLLETPMEPIDYPDNDPGPYTLMAEAEAPETSKKLEWILSRATGYFGLTNYLGSRFLADEKAYGAFAAAARGRGLGFIDDGSAARRGGEIPRATAERVIDDQLSQAAIDQQLLALEASALQRGQALGSGFAYPVTLEKVARWAAAVEERGYQLAPASALAAKR
ncbi:divergent polysaccharide deacetylase family protein [Phenylobacterium sp.]|jgi:polysaccharide deacetylase 2 family uncharacterized protein YibQ|uniref:divergent polysaccharide deacetylase family protein n=1 Tax=Phenylobacterium sp. TaxID=1871053 RepID=UPI002F92F5B4